MKTRFITSAILAVAVVLGWQPVEAQLRIPPASSAQTVVQGLGISTMTLAYSRPNMKGRKVFGGLVPYGQVWRTGANNVTTLTFDEPVSIAGNAVEPGNYGLLTIPGAKSWTVIISKNSQQWGAYTYNEEEDLFRFTVKPKRLRKPVETFTIDFSNVTEQSAMLNLTWEKTKVSFDVVVDQDAEIMASIDEAMEGDKPPYFQAAQYYYKHDKDLDKALEWASEAEKVSPKAPYVRYWKAQMQLKAGDKQGAIETAQQGVELAKQANNSEYVKLNERVIKAAKK